MCPIFGAYHSIRLMRLLAEGVFLCEVERPLDNCVAMGMNLSCADCAEIIAPTRDDVIMSFLFVAFECVMTRSCHVSWQCVLVLMGRERQLCEEENTTEHGNLQIAGGYFSGWTLQTSTRASKYSRKQNSKALSGSHVWPRSS